MKKFIIAWILVFSSYLMIGLKLSDIIDWSWWTVFAPLWIPAGIYLLGIIAGSIWYQYDKGK